MIDRFDPQLPKTSPWLAAVLLYSTYVLIALVSVIAGFKQRINWLKACYVAAMNLAGYTMVIFLKEWTADGACNQQKANGVSGHFAFYVFHLLTIPYLWRDSKWPDHGEDVGTEVKEVNRNPMIVNLLRGLYITLIAVAATTLYRTYRHGYHSLGQCLNGSLCGVLMHVGCVILLNGLDFPSAKRVADARRPPGPSRNFVAPDIPLILFGLFSILALYLAYTWHGHLPLMSWELGILVLVWARILWGP